MRPVTRSPLLVAAAVVVATTLCLNSDNAILSLSSGVRLARADGPITKEQCLILNPKPTVTSCTAYLPPIVDVYGFLPYDKTPAYMNCVKERCLCTGAATSMDIKTSGFYCNSSGWMESGYTTCNVLVDCFSKFWRCMNSAIYMRYVDSREKLDQAEINIMADIVAHGNRPGEPFDITDVFRSCRLMMCAAAHSRQNCGLVTCLPNYTQCDEYIHPPPLPYTRELCTQGCRAVLLMMALTIAAVSFSACCFFFCPAQVRMSEPLLKEEAPARGPESNSMHSEVDTQERRRWIGDSCTQ
ncbi:hypothetical protein, unknown function [Leishmania mexicana MHOM/GT/2001/U1103]|uniref:Uncharacterized protein n=1 Tax=Leishmania mexicana (strain MHOM/GT/2001/U1103) TaxID=929439 RepID=E9AMC5_LEIMU|nr:hypothetical protein, unknown function [Leishmania mexicana MHOM/GT/2001/U1103]CBZ24080.1 hypothetical protein, unknown function [Leishmania mexicana MHOM/GT/2001/U1103]